MGTLYRAQILLEPEQHQALTKIARSEGRSISDLVREIVGQYLSDQDHKHRVRQEIRAIDELTHIRMQLREQHGVCTIDLLNEVRAEREQDTERVWGEEA